MINQLTQILEFMLSALARTWPYLLVTIPLAVAVNLSGASRYIRRAFLAQPLIAIFLATAAGAFSPFCSCTVIPLVASLLIGGVPLAPVMSFWIASPSMDPEAFFLSVTMLGWELAVWRLGATLALSLGAGLIAHVLVKSGWLGENILRAYHPPRVLRVWDFVQRGWERVLRRKIAIRHEERSSTQSVLQRASSHPTAGGAIRAAAVPAVSRFSPPPPFELAQSTAVMAACASGTCAAEASRDHPWLAGFVPAARRSFARQLLRETGKASLLVLQFMTLAFFLEAVITLYVPEAWIAGLLGRENPYSLLTAALLGVPVYTSNLTALPLIGGLLSQGMNPAAALAFLIAGPTTTLPAMSAVYGLVSRRVFAVYLGLSLFGAVLLGYAYQVLAG